MTFPALARPGVTGVKRAVIGNLKGLRRKRRGECVFQLLSNALQSSSPVRCRGPRRTPYFAPMDGDYKYRPRFVDIRIKKPKHETSVDERVCEHPQCRSKATARAPKSAAERNAFYWFCQRHAGEYNKQWNFFEGMSEEAARAHVEADFYGHRPTWSFAAGSTARKKAERASKDFQDGFEDPFSIFGDRPPPGAERAQREAEDPHASMGRLQKRALETLSLEPDATKAQVRKRYAELVRAYHPDSNGGDRSMEELLTRVVQSYQILKGAGMA